MADDPWAKFRGKTALADGPNASKDTGEYTAFGVKDRVDRLKIHRANDPSRSPAYSTLADVTYDGGYGTNFVLIYTFGVMVLVEGKNLQTVISAIQNGMADYLQEYDADRWKLPADTSVPIIDSIKVFVGKGGPSGPEDKGTTVH